MGPFGPRQQHRPKAFPEDLIDPKNQTPEAGVSDRLAPPQPPENAQVGCSFSSGFTSPSHFWDPLLIPCTLKGHLGRHGAGESSPGPAAPGSGGRGAVEGDGRCVSGRVRLPAAI